MNENLEDNITDLNQRVNNEVLNSNVQADDYLELEKENKESKVSDQGDEQVFETTKSEASDNDGHEDLKPKQPEEVPILKQMKDTRYKLKKEINEAKRL